MKPLILAVLLLQTPSPATSRIGGHVVTFPGAKIPTTLTLRIYGQQGPGGSVVTRSIPAQSDGTFQISGVAPGEYTVSVGDPFHSPGRNFTFRSGDVTDLEIKVPAAISGRVVVADGSPLPDPLVRIVDTTPVSGIAANPRVPKTMRSSVSPDAMGNFVLDAFPGENTISLDQLPVGYTVMSIMFGAVNVQGPITLESVPTSFIVITLDRANRE
jgi:hypothetical protein